jgi:hypothetical protein
MRLAAMPEWTEKTVMRIPQPAEKEARRSGNELLRRLYENSVKFTRLVATNDILAANPASFE